VIMCTKCGIFEPASVRHNSVRRTYCDRVLSFSICAYGMQDESAFRSIMSPTICKQENGTSPTLAPKSKRKIKEKKREKEKREER
jgi:hypothetical protein